MKHLLFPAMLVMFIAGCASYNVDVKDNPFTKVKEVELKMWHQVVSGNLDNIEAIYLCEIKDGKRNPSKVKFHFQLGAMMGAWANPQARYRNVNIDQVAHILVDDASYELKVFEIQTDKWHTIIGHKGYVSGGTYNEMYCSVVLSPAIEKQIQNASKVMYRFSAGGEATVLQAKPDQLKKMKEFFSVR